MKPVWTVTCGRCGRSWDYEIPRTGRCAHCEMVDFWGEVELHAKAWGLSLQAATWALFAQRFEETQKRARYRT